MSQADGWPKFARAAAAINLKKQYLFRKIYLKNNEVIPPSLAIISGASLLVYWLYRKARYDPTIEIVGPNRQWVDENVHPELPPAIVSEETLEKRSPVNWTYNRHLERPDNKVDQIRMPTMSGP